MEENNMLENENIPGQTVSGNDTGTIMPVPDNGTEERPPEQDNIPQEEHPDNGTEQKETIVEVRQDFDTGQLSQLLSDIVTDTLAGLEEQDKTEELTERLDEMIMLLTPEETEEEPVVHSQLSIPSADYTEWDYPVRVTYGITTAAGYSTYVGKDMDSPEAFETDFEGMQEDVDAGYLQSFYIRYVYGIGDDDQYSVLLYDSENPVIVPEEPEEPEEDTVADLLFSHLEGINTYLADMSEADAEYYQSTIDYREEMLELQRADTASTIILCVAVFIVAAEIAAANFLGRLK